MLFPGAVFKKNPGIRLKRSDSVPPSPPIFLSPEHPARPFPKNRSARAPVSGQSFFGNGDHSPDSAQMDPFGGPLKGGHLVWEAKTPAIK
jgi:hypothetical protein